MKPARVIILAVAVVAAGLAGYLAMKLSGRSAPRIEASIPVIQQSTKQVLVAKNSLPVGARLNDDAVQWMDWPEKGVVDGFVTKSTRPDAIRELNGTIVRLPIFAGEPIRAEKIVDSSSRIMSSLLPAGKRAVATEITVATGAGGFILPNDRVDVIMVRRDSEGKGFTTETILSNIRVLAIDQRIEEQPDGQKTAVGATATLELSPDQAQIITVAQQMADKLTLALRSVADVQEPDTGGAEYLLSGDAGNTIQVIKSGAVSTTSGKN